MSSSADVFVNIGVLLVAQPPAFQYITIYYQALLQCCEQMDHMTRFTHLGYDVLILVLLQQKVQ